jgi:hypothetical protein
MSDGVIAVPPPTPPRWLSGACLHGDFHSVSWSLTLTEARVGVHVRCSLLYNFSQCWNVFIGCSRLPIIVCHANLLIGCRLVTQEWTDLALLIFALFQFYCKR